MRANSLLLIVFFLAGINQACQSPFGDRFEKDFVINDTLSVQSIQIEGESSFILQRKANLWKLNEDDLANQVAINNVLLSLYRLEKLGVVKNYENKNSKQVNFTIDGGKKLKSFSLYFSVEGAYIGEIDSDEVYRFGIKGLPNINLEEIFSDSIAHWKNPMIFDFSSNTLMEISVNPSVEWGEPFTIAKIEEGWSLLDEEGQEANIHNVDEEKLKDYTWNFSGIYFDKEIVDKNLYAKVLSMETFFSFRIEAELDKEVSFNVYPNYDSLGEYDDFNALMTKSGSESVYLVKYVFLDPLFECYGSFLKK